jgi:cell division septum initiation protein DivIVA
MRDEIDELVADAAADREKADLVFADAESAAQAAVSDAEEAAEVLLSHARTKASLIVTAARSEARRLLEDAEYGVTEEQLRQGLTD